MKYSKTLLGVTGVGFVLLVGTAAAENLDEGVNRMGEGTVQAVTAPAKVVEGISESTQENGAVVGTVTGTTKGAVNAAGEVIKGGANVGVGAAQTGVGIVEMILKPITK